MFGTTCIYESTLSTVNFMKSKYRETISDEYLGSKLKWGLPWWSSAQDSRLPMQGVWVQSWLGNCDPTCCAAQPKKGETSCEHKTRCCCLVTKLCPTLCDPVDYSLPGSSVRRVFQARILESGAIFLSRGSSQPRD